MKEQNKNTENIMNMETIVNEGNVDKPKSNNEQMPGSNPNLNDDARSNSEGRENITKNDIIDDDKNMDRILLKKWLDNVVKLGEYYDNFIQNGYESVQFVKEIRNILELKEIGIELKEHQM